MPPPEFNRMSKGKLESNQQRQIQSSSDHCLLADQNELVELVWENGKIMMQGQGHSNKNKKNSTANTSRKFTTIDSLFNDFGGSSEQGLNQDDELLRWLNYTADENQQPEYVPDFFPELSGVTTKDPSISNNFTLIDKPAHLHPTVRDSASFGSGISDLFSTSHQIQANKGHHTNSTVANFSHFTRPVANVRANLENIVGLSNPVCSSGFAIPPQNLGHSCQKSVVKNDNTMRQVKVGESEKKVVEPMIASSSVCSANSVERTSNDPSNSSKRKSRNSEDSGWQSEDIDEESVGVKKARGRGGTSSKRSRAAEVHNLSERRRRDRINEKMRSLQELIPNCSKGDKASMLDEAIEYLKTLQLQVQIMSMGAGYYMPRMMLGNGMQHMNPMAMGYGFGIQPPHFHRPLMMPHFPPTQGQPQSQPPVVSGSMPLPIPLHHQPPLNSTTGVVTENAEFNF